ncbi:hypothetical protein V5O48_018577 [Marasmius crinis-equi]|uniref:Uncharacterized protein n=1 Tax=Marasmius crinis-equi TaxID=585013 RepID=A0ABR3EKV6_9AGAR
MDWETNDVKYPLAHAAGFRGTKTEMCKEVNARIRQKLVLCSPKPPYSRCFRPHHQGHPVTAPILCINKTEKAGSWIQLVSAYCMLGWVYSERTFYSAEAIMLRWGAVVPLYWWSHLGRSMRCRVLFDQLYAVRKELAQVPRASAHDRDTVRLARSNEDVLSTPPSSPVFVNLTLSPPLGLTSSPPSSPGVLVRTVKGRKDTVLAKFWIDNASASPVPVDLTTQGGVLYLDPFKEPLGHVGVERTPMDFYNERKKHWEQFTWAGGIDLRGKKEVDIRQRGLDVILPK